MVTKESDDFPKKVMHLVSLATKEANGLPKLGGNFELLASFPAYSQLMIAERNRLLQLMKRLLIHSECKVKLPTEIRDNEEFMDRLIEANDAMLERVSNCLDEAEGIRKPEDIVAVPDPKNSAESTVSASLTNFKIPLNREKITTTTRGLKTDKLPLVHNKVLEKPQLSFRDSIDNSSRLFVPKLQVKHHEKARKPGNILVVSEQSGSSCDDWLNDQQESQHPYQYELDHFEPCSSQLLANSAIKPNPIENTPLIYVDSKEMLTNLRDVLNGLTIFAVDLEHHNYRSFLGLTCLVQISTRDADYIVDPFAVWNDLHILNEPFTDPTILKVLHGADMDVEWLQRDFGIYLVNMFDTGQAMRLLDWPKFGLQFLVHKCCSVTLDKRLQKTDWRVRPLPDELQMYARKDTHYLLYCHDRLRMDLLQRGNSRNNLLLAVYTNSRDICLQVYQKPTFDPTGFQKLVSSRKSMNSRQLFALGLLWSWRDGTARMLDESPAFVLPDHMLLHVAEVLPREMQGILACCNPTPPVVKQELTQLYRIVQKARDRPLDLQPTVFVSTPHDEPTGTIDRDRWFKCPHDFSFVRKDEEIRPLSSKIDFSRPVPEAKSLIETSVDLKPHASIDLFSDEEIREKPTDLVGLLADWTSPFDRYQIALIERENQRKNDQKKVEIEVEHSNKQKNRWSHRNSSEDISKLQPSSIPIEFPSDDNDNDDDLSIDEEMILTDKARKKRRKNQLDAVDIPTKIKDVCVSKKKRGKWSDDVLELGMEPFDYSKYSADMFNEKQSKGANYDPFRGSFRGNRAKKNRGRMGRNSRPKTQYFPSKI